MRKKGNIVSYSEDELAGMRAAGLAETDWKAVDAKTDDELAADMASDPAWVGVPADWVSRAQATDGSPQRPKEKKRQVTMRFDADVLEFFKSAGRGWQGRMKAVLRSFMTERQGRR